MAFILHKSFGPIALVNGGAPSLYLSTVGVCVLVLYGCWFVSGDMAADLRNGLRHIVFATPLLGMGLMLPSLLGTPSLRLGLAELTQLAILYLLFVYVAVRLSRRDVEMVLGVLGGLAALELVAAVGQWLTNSPLGLSFLGLPSELGQRVTADGILGRPFGTITHPVFLGAFVGQLGVAFLGLAVVAGRRSTRIAAVAVAACTGVTIAIAQARSAALGFAVASVVVVIVAMAVRRMQWRAVRRVLVVLVAVAAAASPVLLQLYHADLFTSHFSLEVQARGQLLQLGWHIFASHPLLGTGLNTFQQVMDHYATTSLIFDGNPVHNIYALQASETGAIGLLAIPVVAVPLVVLALRAARAEDRLASGLGIGLVAVTAFLAVEELFVFSLREDHPRSLYWLLAGLTVASARFAGLVPGRAGGPAGDPDAPIRALRRMSRWLVPARPAQQQRPPRPRPALGALASVNLVTGDLAPHPRTRTGLQRPSLRRPSSRRLPRWAALGISVASLGGLLAGSVTFATPALAAQLKVVLTLTDRGNGSHEIYVANGDGSDMHALTTPSDGMTYYAAEWAPGGARVTFSAALGNGPEQVYVADADGTHRVPLTTAPWSSGRAHMSPDGRAVIFSSSSPDYPRFGLFRQDIASGQVMNLSARYSTAGAADTDAAWSPDGASVAFVQGGRSVGPRLVSQPSQIVVMNGDGTGRRAVTHDDHYDVDPTFSPDGSTLAFSSYHGSDPVNDVNTGDPTAPSVKLGDFFLVTHELSTGKEHIFNKGENCALRSPADPCGPLDGSAYLPKYLPGGKAIAYMGVLDSTTMCICAVDTDGTHGRVLLSFQQQTVNWYDFTIPTGEPSTAAVPGSARPSSRLLVLAKDANGRDELIVSTPDYWSRVPVRVPTGLTLLGARWGEDDEHVLLTARTRAVNASTVAPEPAPPPGRRRQRHYTIDTLSTLLSPPPGRAGIDREQVFDFDIRTRSLKAVTTAGTEDWMDAIPDGNWRGNGQAVVSGASGSVVFTNYASDTGESFLLRKDLATGAVRNLTNATAGAVPVSDEQPAITRAGDRVAFVTSNGTGTDIAVASATTGTGYRLLTNDGYTNTAPAWGPTGDWLVYASHRGGQWVLVRLDVRTLRQTVLARTHGQPVSPVVSPDGAQIAFIGYNATPAHADVQIVDVDGRNLHALQVTLTVAETSVDWR
jgi:Tol biopolymer transport system component/O-antigen ligase